MPSKVSCAANNQSSNDVIHYGEMVNIGNFPDQIEPVLKNQQITLGDLHGNALKLLYFLIKHKLINGIVQEDYTQFVNIYRKKVNQITIDDINLLKQIIGKIRVVSTAGKARLIGDELADRGSNDYFTLKIIEKLSRKGKPLEIIYSNHSDHFFLSRRYGEDIIAGKENTNSMLNMTTLFEMFANEKLDSELDTILQKHYYPNLKLVSYSIDNKNTEITIYTHAPVPLSKSGWDGIASIEQISEALGVPFKQKTIEDIASTIDQINTVFSAAVLSKDKDEFHKMSNTVNDFIWGRNENLHNPIENHGYSIKYVYGHDMRSKKSEDKLKNLEHLINLDNELGKWPGEEDGFYFSFVCNSS